MKKTIKTLSAALLFLGALPACEDPGVPEITPFYRPISANGEGASQGDRGNLQISEINYAGSVSDDSVYDADDIFIELWNKHPHPINISGWRITVDGDFNASYRIPKVDAAIPINGYFVIARKKDGAFGDIADVFIPELRLGKKKVRVEIRDIDKVLIEDGGSTTTRTFAGGFDSVSVRSMERVSLVFGNRGSNGVNWHAYSEDVAEPTVKKGYRKFTLASPGVANTKDYSGNASAGNFE